jgi:hypothetical protein
MKYRFRPQDMMVPVDGFKAGDIVWSVREGALGIVRVNGSPSYPINVLGDSYTLYGAYFKMQKGPSIFFLHRPGDRNETVSRGFCVTGRDGKPYFYWTDRTVGYRELYEKELHNPTFVETIKVTADEYKTECKCAVPENWADET